MSKDALGDVLLQDRFQVWDSKQIIKKAKERQVFLFETSIFFAKEIKDTREKLKYVHKFKLMVIDHIRFYFFLIINNCSNRHLK